MESEKQRTPGPSPFLQPGLLPGHGEGCSVHVVSLSAPDGAGGASRGRRDSRGRSAPSPRSASRLLSPRPSGSWWPSAPPRPRPSHSAASRPPTNPDPHLGGTLAFLGSSSCIFFVEGPPNCLVSHPPKLVAKTWGAARAGRRVRRHRWAGRAAAATGLRAGVSPLRAPRDLSGFTRERGHQEGAWGLRTNVGAPLGLPVPPSPPHMAPGRAPWRDGRQGTVVEGAAATQAPLVLADLRTGVVGGVPSRVPTGTSLRVLGEKGRQPGDRPERGACGHCTRGWPCRQRPVLSLLPGHVGNGRERKACAQDEAPWARGPQTPLAGGAEVDGAGCPHGHGAASPPRTRGCSRPRSLLCLCPYI